MTTLPCGDFQNEKEYQIITKHWEFVAVSVSVSESFALLLFSSKLGFEDEELHENEVAMLVYKAQ